ncbi:MAG: DNA polymerase III subunit gamma/tau [Patescibacteria group bacterium]|nr:DNA polymerase III subunit gamma/tau [Patescibacteria group bacterium]MCX7589763.1 DNA polymerase III subunit gamma/tau [Patescibacteria group bacterium]MDW8279720.1 DNA polymerase III subunit gamma/tau [bacterium]
MKLALYRKYRPKNFSEIIGQETTVLILKNAAIQNKIGHAYIFYGSRGTGKTTTARILAKVLNCKKRQEDSKFSELGEPCNECEICQAIDNNSFLDVVEIDAASNRGIDEIRNLKEGVQTSPSLGKYKIYIIDEVHMLTGAAFNALLKTLEEPPRHAIFILATTEYEKLPSTIISRAQRFLFKKVSALKILEKLKEIKEQENILIDDEALELIARSSEGSLRDAESILDQISSSAQKITLDLVEELIGKSSLKIIDQLTEMILKNDLASSLEYIRKLNDDGYNASQITKDLISYLRKIIVLHVNPKFTDNFQNDFTKEELKRLIDLSKLVNLDKHTVFLKYLIRAYSEIRYSPFSFIPLEIALIENLKQ